MPCAEVVRQGVADHGAVYSGSALIAITQFTSPRQTRHRQDGLVLSGGRCELGIRHIVFPVPSHFTSLDFINQEVQTTNAMCTICNLR